MLPEHMVPGSSEESVWDYPRPPRLEATSRHLVVQFAGITIAETRSAWRVLETSHPPVYYIPREDIRMEYLHPSRRKTFCEWKGDASYCTVQVGDVRAEDVAWFYPTPTAGFEEIADHVAFYASRMEACIVDGERVRAQPGDFYGGWITRGIVGPFKGVPGTRGW
jgi:uncharacterized protein (DUF427 family)